MNTNFNNWLNNLIQKNTTNLPINPFYQSGSDIIYIYGSGSVALDVQRVLHRHGLPVSAFLDHRKRDPISLGGMTIYQPDDLAIAIEVRSTALIILAIHNWEALVPAILNRLHQLGYRHIITLIELYDLFGQELGDRYWLTSRDFYRTAQPFITTAYRLLADDASRANFEAILEFRLSGNYGALPEPDLAHTYCPPDLPAWQTPIRLVDCGAYNGDTIRTFLEAGYSIEAVAAFEPDLDNFQKLSTFVHEHPDQLPQAALWPCGVFSSTTQLRFDGGHGTASNLSATGNQFIQGITLDDAISGFRPTLIKMDIEGAEYDALLGAHRTINLYRPGLAISTYHRPEHIWMLPILLQRMVPVPSYDFYLRMHGQNSFEAVLYAIPQR